jgi:hypothetical protein
MTRLRKNGKNATGKAILHTGVCMAHNTPLSQKGIFAKIRQRQESMVGIALSGETEIWSRGFGLYCYSKSHSPIGDR